MMEIEPGVLDVLLTVGLGLGLAAACGFRVFVPLLVMSAASLTGHLTLSESFQWIGTYPAVAVLGLATALEIAAYYVPWVDNLLDVAGTPAAIVAGVVVTASAVTGMDPMFQWSLAVIAGGGAAGVVHGAMALVRKTSSLTTGGFANPLVSTAEAGGALTLSALAILVPFLALGLLLVGMLLAFRLLARWKSRRQQGQEAAA